MTKFKCVGCKKISDFSNWEPGKDNLCPVCYNIKIDCEDE